MPSGLIRGSRPKFRCVRWSRLYCSPSRLCSPPAPGPTTILMCYSTVPLLSHSVWWFGDWFCIFACILSFTNVGHCWKLSSSLARRWTIWFFTLCNFQVRPCSVVGGQLFHNNLSHPFCSASKPPCYVLWWFIISDMIPVWSLYVVGWHVIGRYLWESWVSSDFGKKNVFPSTSHSSTAFSSWISSMNVLACSDCREHQVVSARSLEFHLSLGF